MFVSNHHQHWAYVWIPICGAFIWFSTLFSMVITWKARGEPHYVSQNSNLPYISDIGADILKPLFVIGGTITAISFFLSLAIERWLRHSGRLIPNMRRREKIFSSLAIFGSFIGGCGLILLTIFDTKRHPSLHRLFLLVFMVGVVLSAIFTVFEFRWISKEFAEVKKLKHAYITKAIIATILVLLAIGFAIALYQGDRHNNEKATFVGGILEWVIGFGFVFYLLTFYLDLRMSKGMQKGDLSKEKLTAMQNNGTLTHNGHINGPGELSDGGRYAMGHV